MDSSHSFRTLPKKRTTNFREDETKLLIQLWGCPQIQKKLYLTHRKAPVMRLLAANMQQRGFYRTPDEIKTRIRNLKCLYHRIKRTMQNGTGIGTVDPDWPHFKALDEILNKQSPKKEVVYSDNIFEGPKCEDIKQEIEDIDINDDMESYTTNSFNSSDNEDTQMPILTPAPQISVETRREAVKETDFRNIQIKPKPTTVLSNVTTIPIQQLQNSTANHPTIGIKQGTSTLPFPLLILNGVGTSGANIQQVATNNNNNTQEGQKKTDANASGLSQTQSSSNSMHSISELRELLDVQKEMLEVEKDRLELEKQKFEFERLVGTQLLTLIPMIGGLLDSISTSANSKNGRKNSTDLGYDVVKDNKILKNILQQGIRKFMLSEDGEDSSSDKEEEEEDSGIQNEENSRDNN